MHLTNQNSTEKSQDWVRGSSEQAHDSPLSVPAHRLMIAQEIAVELRPFTVCDLLKVGAVATLRQAGVMKLHGSGDRPGPALLNGTLHQTGNLQHTGPET